MVYYTLAIETLGLIVSILGYLHERSKREKIELAYTEVNTKLRITQENTQQVNTNLQHAITIVNEINIPQEDKRHLAQELTSATSTTANSLALGLAKPLNELREAFLKVKLPGLRMVVEEKEKNKE